MMSSCKIVTVPTSAEDKADVRYVEKLQQARVNTAAVRGGCATEEQTRIVRLNRRTSQEPVDQPSVQGDNASFLFVNK
jgi:hypothetical protein